MDISENFGRGKGKYGEFMCTKMKKKMYQIHLILANMCSVVFSFLQRVDRHLSVTPGA